MFVPANWPSLAPIKRVSRSIDQFSEFVKQRYPWTRLTYNCAHLRSTKESLTDSVKNLFVRKKFCVKICWVNIFWVKAIIAGYNKVFQIKAGGSDLIKCSILVWWEYNRRANDARQPGGGERGHLFSAKYHSDFRSHLSCQKRKIMFFTSNYSSMQYNC